MCADDAAVHGNEAGNGSDLPRSGPLLHGASYWEGLCLLQVREFAKIIRVWGLRQRIQLHTLVEACAGHGAEVVAKGLAARCGKSYGSLRLACGIRSGGGEAIRWSGKIFHSSRMLVRPVPRPRVQLLIDRLAAPSV